MIAAPEYQNGGMTSVGLEVVQTQAFMQVLNGLTGALERQAEAWKPADKQIAAVTRKPFIETVLEPVRPENAYPGARLGILGMPWDRFPALSVMVDQATPSPESSTIDQASYVYSPQLYIECVLRSDAFSATPHVDPEERIYQEGLVDRRAKRTIEALVETIGRDPSLGGIVPQLPAPQVAQTDPFDLNGEEPGDQYKQRIFALVRVQYTLDTYASRIDASSAAVAVLPVDFPA